MPGKPFCFGGIASLPAGWLKSWTESADLDRVARCFFGAKRQSCCGIDVGRVVVIYGEERDVDDARCFHVSSQLDGFTAEMHATRDDFDFHMRGARKV